MGEFVLRNLDLLLFLSLLVLGYGAGTVAERRHYASIRRRERELVTLPVTTTRNYPAVDAVREAFLVRGSVVVSIDYFKRLLAVLRNIFGGRVKSYESLVDRARREAILRLKEAARARGADICVNLRLETSAIGRSANQEKHIGSVEVVAYATALVFEGTARRAA
ncbi:YbjQ family protein [Dissulfurirhabdus thermomarina]|uniref:YbjQ family protein n=1 Tax=Dissulfurirhabdus thermomarina TaxID=1765737 RepID=A0A6N9TTC5_DISTH|nr:heavy metal-binding domain-containing protein [Dissulfurirhabdus thermomarina]NDY41746.1 YbjQ family protein [Dissulfurirhabdus thermomarina]NMX23682.1 YbjQ family protein [Dissulfurirhabdus thermomarina]